MNEEEIENLLESLDHNLYELNQKAFKILNEIERANTTLEIVREKLQENEKE